MNKLAHGLGAMAVSFMLMAPTAQAHAAGHAPANEFTKMAPLAQYLSANTAAEIALARSAAPPGISGKATIEVLGRSGYVTAVKGTNGFVCIVERSWMSPYNAAEFWNPKLRGPDCYNPQAVTSILPMVYQRTALALRGLSKDQIQAAMNQGMSSSMSGDHSSSLLPGAMSYMMSRQQQIGPKVNAWRPHLMFYTPENADWGADADGSPVILTPLIHGSHESMKMFLIPVLQWSDGSPAPPL